MRSASVDLPWSMCAMIEKLRILLWSMGRAMVLGAREGTRAPKRASVGRGWSATPSTPGNVRLGSCARGADPEGSAQLDLGVADFFDGELLRHVLGDPR